MQPTVAPSLDAGPFGRARPGCGNCPIHDRAVCAYCDDAALARLDAIKTYRDHPAGRDILSAGEPAAFVGSIVSGVVKLTKTLPDGRAQMVGLLFAGDFVGHPNHAEAVYDATAATEVRLCTFQRAPFARLLREMPGLERRLLDMTLTELDAAREWLLLLGRKTAREKIASFLMGLAARRHRGRHGPTGSVEIPLPLTRGEMADHLGLTIETVSRHMTRFRLEGLVAFADARSVTIPDLDRLAAEAGD